jgi:hypothetical protein
VPALAYYRTSSAANVGQDKDSEKRQRQAVEGYATRNGFAIIANFYDAAVSGADPIEQRAGFANLLDRIEENGVRTVIVEDASRFARELMAQELGISALIKRGVRLLTDVHLRTKKNTMMRRTQLIFSCTLKLRRSNWRGGISPRDCRMGLRARTPLLLLNEVPNHDASTFIHHHRRSLVSLWTTPAAQLAC